MKRSQLQRKTPLKRTKSKRPMSQLAMFELVQKVMLRDGRCVAADHAESFCDGQTDAAHLIPQRILKAHYEGKRLAEILGDERNAQAMCRKHHGEYDHGHLEIPRQPDGFEDFCQELGFEWSGRYWAKGAA
jgi:hypothetical protein